VDFYDINIAVIRRHYPGLAEQFSQLSLLDAPVAAAPAPEIRLETAVNGEMTLVVNGAYVHSKHNPGREGARLAETLVGDGPLIALGFGLGYALTAASQRTRPFIIIERYPALLKKALESRDLTKFLSENTVIFMLGGPEDAVLSALQLFESEGVDIVRNRACMALDAAWYAGVERQIDTWAAKDTVNAATLKRFGASWQRNAVKNRRFIRDLPGINRIKNCLRGEIPVLLIAAGPSLDRIAPLLPLLAERALLVAVDTSLRRLLAAGVDPDFTVSADPQYWNARHLDCIQSSKTCLITEAAVHPLTLRHFTRAFLYSSPFPPARAFEDAVDHKGRLGAGGSVATAAFDFALVVGAASIWIAGLDLSFPAFKTHFKGALFEERANAEANRLCPAETKSIRALRDGRPFYAPSLKGGQVLTDKRLSLYAAWFEYRLRALHGSLPVYSLAGEGLAIAGLPFGAPEDLRRLPVCRPGLRRLLDKAFSRATTTFEQERPARTLRYEAARW
jgi:hypothetical protein